MDYIEKLNLQIEEVEEIEPLEKHNIINSEPITVNEYIGHTKEFLALDGDYVDGFNQLNETNGLGISCIVSKEVKEARKDVNGNIHEKLKDRIDSEVNVINSSLENLESEVNDLKEGNINIDLTNYVTKSDLSTKADKTELHSHPNKTVLDGISSAKVTEWNNKSTFSGNYNDLTNKPTIPTLNGYATEQYVNEEIKKIDVTEQLTDYAKKSELHSHSNKSVLDGITSSKVTEWNNKSTFDGNYNNLTNKPTIPTKTSQLTNDSGFITTIPSEYVTETELNNKGYLTQHQDLSNYATKTQVNAFDTLTLGINENDGLMYIYKQGVPMGLGLEIGVKGDIIGYIDSDNNIILSGVLANDTYTVKYEMEDGTLLDIGVLKNFDEPVIIFTNQIPISVTASGALFVGTNGEKGYKTGYRLSSSSGNESALANYEVTGFIPVKLNNTVYIKNITTSGDGQSNIVFYKADKTFITGVYTSSFFDTTNGDVKSGVVDTKRFSKLTSDVAFIRISAVDITENSILTVNEPIV